jgi:transcriptional regulator with XRE-family HTH domain
MHARVMSSHRACSSLGNPMSDSPSLGEFIRERRRELGLTQEQLAEHVGEGVRQAEISRLENGGIKLPRKDRLGALASALHVSIGELLLRSGWIGEEERILLEQDPSSALSSDRSESDAVAASMEDLSRLLDALIAGRARLAEIDRAIEQTEMTITKVLEKMGDERHSSVEVRIPIGVIKKWENTQVFIG